MKSVNLVLIPSAKMDHHRGTWTGYFVKFTGNYLCQNLFFKKVGGLRPTPLLKKRLWHRCFPVNFATFFGTPFFIEHLWWLLLCFLLYDVEWLKSFQSSAGFHIETNHLFRRGKEKLVSIWNVTLGCNRLIK